MSTNTTFLKHIVHAYTDARARNAQLHTREYLLGLGNGYLDHMHLSRQLIKQGPNAWPWRKLEKWPKLQQPLIVPGLSAVIDEPNNDGQSANVDQGRRGTGQVAGFDRTQSGNKLAA
jgi:hypothetical protein